MIADAQRAVTGRARKPFIREAKSGPHPLCGKSMEIGTNGVQLLGGHGFTKEHPLNAGTGIFVPSPSSRAGYTSED